MPSDSWDSHKALASKSGLEITALGRFGSSAVCADGRGCQGQQICQIGCSASDRVGISGTVTGGIAFKSCFASQITSVSQLRHRLLALKSSIANCHDHLLGKLLLSGDSAPDADQLDS